MAARKTPKPKKIPKWGWVDAAGKWVIEPRFDEGRMFVGGLAAASDAGHWGYIDRAATFILPPTYTKTSSFVNGVAAVSVGAESFEIDREGKRVPSPSAPQAVPVFSEGLAPSAVDGKLGYIDEARRWVIEPRFTHAQHFREGLAWVVLPDDDGLTCIDTTGSVVFALQAFHAARNFSDGMAHVSANGARHTGFVDRAGKLVHDLGDAPGAPPWWGNPAGKDFSDGLAPVYRNGKWTVVDKAGNTAFETDFTDIEPYRNGFARVSVGGGDSFQRWGFIDRKGAVVYPTKLDKAFDFDDVEGRGLAGVHASAFEDASEWGLIDTSGRLVVGNLAQIMGFDEKGEATATVGGVAGSRNAKYGRIDRSGKWLVEPTFEQLGAFVEDRATAKLDGKWGIIGRDGQWLAPAKYDRIEALGELTAVNVGGETNKKFQFVGGEWGFVDRAGTEVIAPRFVSAGRFSEGLVAVATLV